MKLPLEPDMPMMYLLPEVDLLQDVTSIRVEIVGVSGANKTTLDVDILGCSKGKPFHYGIILGNNARFVCCLDLKCIR